MKHDTVRRNRRGATRKRLGSFVAVVALLASTAVSIVGPAAATAGASTTGVTFGTLDTLPEVDPQPVDVFCTSTSDCIAAASTFILTTSDGGLVWTEHYAPGLYPRQEAVACATALRCVVVGGGAVYETPDGGSTWIPENYANFGMNLVTCPSATVCVGVAASPGEFTSAWSSDGGQSWNVTLSSDADFGASQLTCTTTTHCILVGADETVGSITPDGAVIMTTDDAGTSWNPVSLPVAASDLTGVACISATQCLAVGWDEATGNQAETEVLFTTSDAGASWAVGSAPAGLAEIDSVTCYSAQTCVVTGLLQGNPVIDPGAATSTDGGSTWPTAIQTPDMVSVSCPSASLCIGVGNGFGAGAPAIVTSTTDAGQSWEQVAAIGDEEPSGLSCGSSQNCVALTPSGYLRTGDGGIHWTAGALPAAAYSSPFEDLPGEAIPTDLSCPTASQCVGVGYDNSDGGPTVFVVTSDGGQTWQAETLTGQRITTVSCSMADVCVAVGTGPNSEGTLSSVALISQDGGVTWTSLVPPAGVTVVSDYCSSAQDCMVGGIVSNTQWVIETTTDGGADWSTASVPSEIDYVSDFICTSATNCYIQVTEQESDGTSAAILRSTDDGNTWSSNSIPLNLSIGYTFDSLSCVSAENCYAALSPNDPGSTETVIETTDGQNWTTATNYSCPTAPLCVIGSSGYGISGLAAPSPTSILIDANDPYALAGQPTTPGGPDPEYVVWLASESGSVEPSREPTGTVEFEEDGVPIPGCTAQPINILEEASCVTTPPGPGHHQLTVSYGGDQNNLPAVSSPLPQLVEPYGSTVTLRTSIFPAPSGAPVTFTATVNGVPGSSVTGLGPPRGTVSFSADGGPIARCTNLELDANAQASCKTSFVGTSNVSVSATYSGSTDFSSSSSHSLSEPVDPPAPVCSSSLPSGTVVGMATTPDGDGYWIASSTGAVAACGDAPSLGSGSAGTAAITAAPTGTGYWLVTGAGAVEAFGSARNFGEIPASAHLSKPIVAMAADPATGGYWLLGGDGGVFSFHAPFYGSTGNIELTKPAVGIESTPSGKGYRFVASDGGIFDYGDAKFYGSTGGVPLDKPVIGMADDPATGGYWLDASDGGIFAFHAPFYGSTGRVALTQPCVGMTAMPKGNGYRFVAADGGIFSFHAPFEGSATPKG